jgi:tetratricopeptide (TPR) repeat protein
MARKGLPLLLAAALLLAALPRVGAAPDDDKEKKILNLLAVQKALQQGREALKRGDYQAAVAVLEARIAYIGGDKEYLDALRDAYVGYIRELKQAGRTADLPTYLRRLECCDPGALLEVNAPPKAAAPAPARPAEAVAAAPPALTPNPSPPGGEGSNTTSPLPPGERRRGEAAAGDGQDKVKTLFDQAEKEFAARHYAEAGRLYEQCNRLDPAALGDGKERWAYCRVYAIVEAFNQGPADAPAPPEWEREVRQAAALAPDNKALGVFAGNLLNKIQDRRGPAVRAAAPDEAEVEVRHTPRQAGQAWAVAETANFRIFHNQTKEVAEKAARVAEAARAMAAKKWFGDAAAAWDPRCDLYLHATAQDYSLATRQPPTLAGHSSVGQSGGHVVSRRIDLHCDDPNLFIGVLPHETTHVVLAGNFGGRVLPHWADEGMAVLSEPRDRIDLHLHNLPRHRDAGELFAVAELMRMDQYPDGKRIGAFYAESVSLVEYLSKQKGPQTFAQFMRDGLAGGYEAALQKYYDIRGFDDLQQRWQRYAFGG